MFHNSKDFSVDVFGGHSQPLVSTEYKLEAAARGAQPSASSLASPSVLDTVGWDI